VLVAHPHFHRRRTGVTAHTEAILQASEGLLEARGLGPLLADVPKCSLYDVWCRAGQQATVWHAHRNIETIVGLTLRALGRKLRVVVTRHTGAPPGRFSKWLYRQADAVVALTDDSALHIGRAAQVIAHGVDVAHFKPPSDRAMAAAALELGPGPLVGVLGRVREAKGTGDFVRAYAGLQTPWRGVVQGLVKPAERTFAQALQAIAPTLQWRPPTADVRALLQGLTVLVQPSRSEGFSMVTLEAMASGCCVVAAALPYTQGLIEHERTGLLYPPGDIAALTTCLEKVIHNPELPARIGRAARERVTQKHSIQTEAETLAELYQSLSR
jgi:mannosyltransferase